MHTQLPILLKYSSIFFLRGSRTNVNWPRKLAHLVINGVAPYLHELLKPIDGLNVICFDKADADIYWPGSAILILGWCGLSPYHQWVPSNKAITIKLVIGMLNLSWSHSASFSKLVQLYTELTGFIVFLKKLWSAKWIENVVEYQRVLEVSMLVKLYVSKESNFQGHFFLKSSKSHALIHWLT